MTPILIFSACDFSSSWKSDLPYSVARNLSDAESAFRDTQKNMKNFQREKNFENLCALAKSTKKLELQFENEDLTAEQILNLKKAQRQIDSLKRISEKTLHLGVSVFKDVHCDKKDELLSAKNEFAFYAFKGDSIFCKIKTDAFVSVNFYNADTKQLLKQISSTKNVDFQTLAPNSAIYLVTIDGGKNFYGDVFLATSTRKIENLISRKTVKTETVEASKNDFRVETVSDVKMRSLFDEPRKFTLRGQLKAAFSGSARALLPIQVPTGATDILYSLRISTNEGSRGSDGDFEKNLNLSHRKIRLLGLPLYESQFGSGLLATILGENLPPREEDAYINMYVFYDAAHARKFQNGADIKTLKYNLDFSTIGTQSCNGRIPSRGNKTIYLAFENERVRFNNYVFLEALAITPTTTYFGKRYVIED